MCIMITNKKAMSPLIATVLVIAFAVAIGVMIMNWSSDIQPSVDATDYCDGLSITANKPICFDTNSLMLDLKNDGTAKFDGVLVRSVSDSGDLELKLKDSTMIPRESLEKRALFPYVGGEISLKVLPFVMVDGSAVACEAGSYSQNELATC